MMLFRKFTFTFFQQKILQRCLRREWVEWVGTFVIEMIAEPNFWTIPFLKKNEKKSVNFNLSNHWTKGLPTVKTFVFFFIKFIKSWWWWWGRSRLKKNTLQILYSSGDLFSTQMYIRRSLRSWIQFCPKALAKFWRSDGWRKSIFALTSEKLRSTAFQRCISWGGVRLVEMGKNSHFLKKNA